MLGISWKNYFPHRCRNICMSCVVLLFSTMMVGLHHCVSVDHLSDQLHCVVQQFRSPDLSPGSCFSLFKLSQQVTGSQGAFRQRLLHPGNINSFVFLVSRHCVIQAGSATVIFTFRLCGRKQHRWAQWPSEEPPSQTQIPHTQFLELLQRRSSKKGASVPSLNS